jgi:hypothetical protein
MRVMPVLLVAAAFSSGTAQADSTIYRCGDEYKTGLTSAQAKARGCKRMGNKELGPEEQERYHACQMSAAQAPTEIGVQAALRSCRERFEQESR